MKLNNEIHQPETNDLLKVSAFPEAIMLTVTEETLAPIRNLKRKFDPSTKDCWQTMGMLLLIGSSFLFRTSTTIRISLLAVKWRSALFFLQNTLTFYNNTKKYLQSDESIDSVELVSSALNWAGLGLIVVVLAFRQLQIHLNSIPILNLVTGSLFTLAEIFDAVCQYKLDTALLKKVESCEGALKTEALQHLSTKRLINLSANTLKIMSTVVWLILPAVGFATPVNISLILTGFASYLAFSLIQNGVNMYRAHSFHQQFLFKSPEKSSEIDTLVSAPSTDSHSPAT